MSRDRSAKAPGGVLIPISRPRASEEAHGQLRTKILSGELAPGTRLIEAAFAKRLGISQSTLREALSQLAHEGLVLTIPRRGTYVAALPVETVNHLYELRARVEPLALRLAMERLKPSDVEYLERQLKQLDARSVSHRINADMAFHGYLYELSGFPLLQGLWPQMEVITRKFVSMSRRISSAETTRENHRAILTALATRDEHGLDRAIESHMRQTAAVLEGRPRQDPADHPLTQAPRQ